MAKIAADMWKVLQSSKGAGGNNSTGISEDGARINHGRDMDERGVSTGKGGASGSSGAPGNSGGSSGGGDATNSGTGNTKMTSPLSSREAAFADQGALGFSPGAVGAFSKRVTEGLIQPAGFVGMSNTKNLGSTPAMANNYVTNFSSRGSALLFQVDRMNIANRLLDLISDPDRVAQGDLNLCGPAAVFRTVLRRDPLLCAMFTIDLVEKGKGKFGRDEVNPRLSLRNQTFQANWDCPVAEWVAMSSLRDDENWLFDFNGTPEEGFDAMTLPGEIENWLLATNLYSKVENNANKTINKSLFSAQALQHDNNTDNLLLIHSDLLKFAIRHRKPDEYIDSLVPNHWVVLDSLVTVLTPLATGDTSPNRVHLKVWSYGDLYTLDVPEETFKENYYGAVTATV